MNTSSSSSQARPPFSHLYGGNVTGSLADWGVESMKRLVGFVVGGAGGYAITYFTVLDTASKVWHSLFWANLAEGRLLPVLSSAFWLLSLLSLSGALLGWLIANRIGTEPAHNVLVTRTASQTIHSSPTRPSVGDHRLHTEGDDLGDDHQVYRLKEEAASLRIRRLLVVACSGVLVTAVAVAVVLNASWDSANAPRQSNLYNGGPHDPGSGGEEDHSANGAERARAKQLSVRDQQNGFDFRRVALEPTLVGTVQACDVVTIGAPDRARTARFTDYPEGTVGSSLLICESGSSTATLLDLALKPEDSWVIRDDPSILDVRIISAAGGRSGAPIVAPLGGGVLNLSDSSRTAPVSATPDQTTPSPSHEWWCTCFRELDSEGAFTTTTACRSSPSQCDRLARAARGSGTRTIIPGSLVAGCQRVAGLPASTLGGSCWQESARAGGWACPGSCLVTED